MMARSIPIMMSALALIMIAGVAGADIHVDDDNAGDPSMVVRLSYDQPPVTQE